MNEKEQMEQVDLVDKLMTCFRNGVEPSDETKLRAYELNINVAELRTLIEEVEFESLGEEDAEG